jgi:hypothetical protein
MSGGDVLTTAKVGPTEELDVRLCQLDTYTVDLNALLAELAVCFDKGENKRADKVADEIEGKLCAFRNALDSAELDASVARRAGSLVPKQRLDMKAARTMLRESETKLAFGRAQVARRALIGDASVADREGLGAETVGATMQYGRAVMAETTAGLDRTKAVVEEARGVGASALVRLDQQNQQLATVIDNVTAIDGTMLAAGKTLRRMSRRMAQDKCLGGLTAAVIGILLFILIKKA